MKSKKNRLGNVIGQLELGHFCPTIFSSSNHLLHVFTKLNVESWADVTGQTQVGQH